MKINADSADVVSVLCAGLAIRTIVSLHSYSGAGKPPMYGDYEAQRHWQEVTVNLSPRQWYTNSTDNDLLYWGLDYPPITAYHSYLLGLVAQHINLSFVTLHTSRGYESSEHKNFMRLTVLLADIAVYLPAILIVCLTLRRQNSKHSLLMYLLPMLLYPGQILIDNGHFQYNNISLGLCLLGMNAILNDKVILGALFYTLSLNYKQMELYHALPFFVYLLRFCFEQKNLLQKLKTFVCIALAVLLTFAVIWLPWLSSLQSILTVLERLFPIGRGVFEDKVANFWCAFNTIFKLRKKLSNSQTALLCLGTTAAAIIPINAQLFVDKRKKSFLYALTNTAMAFYLFSFQVHEKSVLLAALPALCLFASKSLEIFWFLQISTFSMLPLLVKDGLTIPFFAMLFVYQICIGFIRRGFMPTKSEKLENIASISIYIMFLIALASLIVPPPARYPYLWSLIICLYSFAHFFIFFAYSNICQFYNKIVI